jgi:hypothetical protein
MNKMFQDINLSKDFATKFDEYVKRPEDSVALASAQILSQGAWPIHAAENCKITYPIRLQSLAEQL